MTPCRRDSDDIPGQELWIAQSRRAHRVYDQAEPTYLASQNWLL